MPAQTYIQEPIKQKYKSQVTGWTKPQSILSIQSGYIIEHARRRLLEQKKNN